MSTIAPPEAPKQPGKDRGRSRREKPGDFGLDTARLRRLRIIWMSVIAIPVLILALLAVRFVSMPITQATVRSAYADKEYQRSIDRLWPFDHANWFEPYLPHLSRGTALLAEGKNAEAEAELRISLADWEKGKDLNHPQHAQCKILNNLAISIERQAMEIPDAKTRADRLFEAEDLLSPCAGGGGGGDGEGDGSGGGGEKSGQGGGQGNEDKETTGKNGKRIEEERREADKEAGNDPDGRPDKKGDQGGKQTKERPSNSPRRQDPSGSSKPVQGTTPAGTDEQKKQDEVDKRNKGANGGDGETPSGTPSQQEEKPW